MGNEVGLDLSKTEAPLEPVVVTAKLFGILENVAPEPRKGMLHDPLRLELGCGLG